MQAELLMLYYTHLSCAVTCCLEL